MAVEGGSKIIKYLLFIFNLVFVIAGIALIVGGIVVQVSFKDYFAILDDSKFSASAIFIIIIGVIVFIIALFGCWGAWNENRCCILVFAGLLTLIFILEIVGFILGLVFRGKVESVVEKGMKKSMDKYDPSMKDSASAITKAWNFIQKEFKCCGEKNPASWNTAEDWSNSTTTKKGDVPDSCCQVYKDGCGKTGSGEKKWEKGCYQSMLDYLKGKMIVIIVICVVVALIELFGIVFACCLARAISKSYETV